MRKKDRARSSQKGQDEKTTPRIKTQIEEERITLTIENFEAGKGLNIDGQKIHILALFNNFGDPGRSG